MQNGVDLWGAGGLSSGGMMLAGSGAAGGGARVGVGVGVEVWENNLPMEGGATFEEVAAVSNQQGARDDLFTSGLAIRTQQEVADLLGISQPVVAKTEKRALRKVAKLLAAFRADLSEG